MPILNFLFASLLSNDPLTHQQCHNPLNQTTHLFLAASWIRHFRRVVYQRYFPGRVLMKWRNRRQCASQISNNQLTITWPYHTLTRGLFLPISAHTFSRTTSIYIKTRPETSRSQPSFEYMCSPGVRTPRTEPLWSNLSCILAPVSPAQCPCAASPKTRTETQSPSQWTPLARTVRTG